MSAAGLEAEPPLPGPGSPSCTPELLPVEPELELAPLLDDPLPVLPLPPPDDPLLPELLLDDPDPELLLLPWPLPLPLLLVLLPLRPPSSNEVPASSEPLELPETPPSSPWSLSQVSKPKEMFSALPSGAIPGPPPPPPPEQLSPAGHVPSDAQSGAPTKVQTAQARLTPVPPAPEELDELPPELPPPELLPPEPASKGGTAHPFGSSQHVAAMQVPPLHAWPMSATAHSWRSVAEAVPVNVRPIARRGDASQARFIPGA